MSVVSETVEFPSSSNLASASYEPDSDNLTIEFRDGSSYTYMNVPPAAYRGLCNAGSAGEYFARQIKGRYNYERMD